jgi:methionine synthase / methylenetetrahydrofolate reductase(NADPH)
MQSANDFLAALQNRRPVLADGAMGTMLHTRGVLLEQCFDELNLSKPALISGIHHEYIQAGAQVIKTNTFGANRYKLGHHGLEHEVIRINQAAVDLVSQAAGSTGKRVFIAGDIGPLGVHLAPFGRIQPELARTAFVEQIRALCQAGVDLILIETMSDIYEVHEAMQAARQVEQELSQAIPLVASVTFTRDDLTLLGDTPQKVALALWQDKPDLIGINCSSGPEQLLRLMKIMRKAVPEARFSVMPNAGWPARVRERIIYPAGPDYFGDYACAFKEAGASLVGGCCGTTPQHIASMRQALDSGPEDAPVVEIPVQIDVDEIEVEDTTSTQLSKKLLAGKFVIAVELDPPRGSSPHKLLAAASLLAEAGADVIDVSDSPMARMRMSPWAACNLIQNQVGIETVLHFPTRGRNLLRVQGDLLAAYALGVRNIFVMMGDPTAIGDYPHAMDNFDLVPSGLIKLIKQRFNLGLDQAGTSIGPPTNFFVGCALNPNSACEEDEVKNLRRKVLAGADFILTQPVFDLEPLKLLLRHYIEQYGNLNIPVLAGILPLASLRHAYYLNEEVPGISIPPELLRRLEVSGNNSYPTGNEIAIELAQRLREMVQGVYLIPAFNRFDQLAEIIDTILDKK